MSEFYTEQQRQLQDAFQTRTLADMAAAAIVAAELNEQQIRFIGERDMFFLSTVDRSGFPSCSYKGGQAGFVRVVDSRTIVFPNYDGNGMFLSLGNIEATAKVGLLFIDFVTPRRMRVRGDAQLRREGPMVDSYPGALCVTEVAIERVWQNCPRYVHRMQPRSASPYVPRDDGSVKLAPWKRIDVVQGALTEADRHEAQSLGLITTAEYEAMEAQGTLD